MRRFLAPIVLLLALAFAPAAYAFAHLDSCQHNNSSTPTNTVACTLTSAIPANAALGLTVAWFGPTSTQTVSISDGGTNTYTSATTVCCSLSAFQVSTFYLCGATATGSAPTLTATVGGTAEGFGAIFVDEYSGAAITACLDQKTGQDQRWTDTTGNALTSGNVTTVANGELIYGSMVDGGSYGLAAGAGFIQRQYFVTSYLTEDLTQATAGVTAATATGTGTSSADDDTVAMVMTFKPVAVAASCVRGSLLLLHGGC